MDRYIGIPLVYLLGKITSGSDKDQLSLKLHRIILIKIGTIGDTLLTFPLIKHLKKEFPNTRIEVICGNANEGIVKRLKDSEAIDNYYKIEVGKIVKNPGYLYKTIRNINNNNYDLLVDLEPWARISALISAFINADLKTGFKKFNQYRHYVYDKIIEHNDEIHEIKNYNNLLKDYTGEVDGKPEFPIHDSEYQRCQKFLKVKGIDKYIAFHPWAGGYRYERKQLDPALYVEIGKYYIDQGYEIIITGGSADIKKTNELVEKIGRGAYSQAGKLSLAQTAAFLQTADCVLSVNTGIMHLAAAVNANLVSLNGPTDINRWGPLSENSIDIKSSAPCSPCLDLGFEYKCKKNGVPAGWCMTLFKKNEIINAINKQLNTKPQEFRY